MKSSMIFMGGLLSILLISPAVVSAEDSASGAEGIMPVSVEAPMPTRESPTRGSGKATPKLMEAVAPRDTASGQATGMRMMASGTKPMPPEMEKRMEVRDRMMASGTSINEEKREATQERMQERRSEVVRRIALQMVTRTEAAIARYVKLADRLDSRVAKLAAGGKDTASAVANITIARTKIAEAKTAVALAKSQIESIVAHDSSAGNTEPGKAVREALAKARTAITEAHKALVEATKSLKSDSKSTVTPPTPTTVTP